jgi:hypothetical protein
MSVRACILLYNGSSSVLLVRFCERGARVNCWEYKNCREDVFKICPAYPEDGSACYTLSGVKCGESMQEFASLDEQVGYCSKCSFYAYKRRGLNNGSTSMPSIIDNDNSDTALPD